ATTCPNRVKEVVPKATSMFSNKPSPIEDQEEGFVKVKGQKKKRKAGSNQHRHICGIKLSILKFNFQYPLVSKAGKDMDDASNLGANGPKEALKDSDNIFKANEDSKQTSFEWTEDFEYDDESISHVMKLTTREGMEWVWKCNEVVKLTEIKYGEAVQVPFSKSHGVGISLLSTLNDSLVAILFLDGLGHSLETVVETTREEHGGFIQVTRKNGKVVQKPPNNDGEASSSHQVTSNWDSEQLTSRHTVSVDEVINLVSLCNSFKTLMEKDKILDFDDNPQMNSNDYNDLLEDDDKEVEEVFREQVESTLNRVKPNDFKRVSTLYEGLMMYNLASWNIRASSNLQGLCSKVFKNWQGMFNGSICVKGAQIISSLHLLGPLTYVIPMVVLHSLIMVKLSVDLNEPQASSKTVKAT
ncbi:hypothetical protein Tco_1222045, partial [Tanacetum coccineum]